MVSRCKAQYSPFSLRHFEACDTHAREQKHSRSVKVHACTVLFQQRTLANKKNKIVLNVPTGSY